MSDTTTAAATADDLLAAYRPGAAFLFAAPGHTLLAEGTYFAVPPSVRPEGLADLPARVDAVLRVAQAAGHDDPVVVGAVPFDPAAPAALWVPQQVHRAGPRLDASRRDALRVPSPSAARFHVSPEPSPDAYLGAVGEAVRRMRAGELAKVVLARSLRVRGEVDLAALLGRLAVRDPGGYAFGVDLPGGATLVGASPELLVSRRGRRVVANPLAGSVPRAADPVENRRRAAALLASGKDRHEHAVVVDAVVEALRPLCDGLDVPAEPSLAFTPDLCHLSTVVTGELADPGTSALALAAALHPTPAVCGWPVATARAAITELEGFDRGFYTGAIGWGDSDGDGEWVVTIRCAQSTADGLRLFAGAGVVAGSEPAAELAETTAKFATMLGGLGVIA